MAVRLRLSETGRTALHHASCGGHLEVVNTLLSSGANILATDDFGWTALHFASAGGHLEMVNTLLCSGANILATNSDGNTPLHSAAICNQYDVCLVLLQHGASVEMKNKANKTPLERRHHKAVQLLESYTQKEGNTPLHFAAYWGCYNTCLVLLQHGATEVEMKNKDGDTPLHKAVYYGSYDICLILLQHGASVDTKNKDNKTPIDIAKTEKHDNMIQLLKSHEQKRRNLLASLQKSLNNAKNQHGKIPVRFIKILLTGSGAAGKTSFSNLLMKKQINKDHHSTKVVQSKHAISIRKAALVESKHTHGQEILWLEMDDNAQITHLRQVLLPSSTPEHQKLHPQKTPPQKRHNEPKVTDNRQISAIDANIKQKYEIKQVTQLSITQRFAALFQSSVKSEKLESFKALAKNSTSSISTHTSNSTPLTYHPGEVLNIITILDTGGQPEYIQLLPTVNIHPMITFIVHDLSRNLEDQVLVEYSEHGKHIFEPYHLQYSNFDMIKFLMSSNNDALERPTSQVPQLVTVPGNDTNSYLCCVGTHADKVCSDVVHKINSRLVNMVEKLDCKATVWRNKDSGVIFPVDNTTAGRENTEDPTAKLIRNEIETLSLKKDVYELPITWMLLELEIRQVCTGRGTAYISFQECVSIASQSNLITDVEQVRSALLYHHLLGVLLYYPEVSGLCDYIIIDHQWLFDRLSKIVCFTFKKSLSNQSATNKLKHSGILSKELLQSLQWEDDLKQDYFVSLLVVMKIISPIPREDGDGEDYFIPYVLPTYTSQPTGDLILSQYGCLQGEPLLIQFVSNLLPRGFFCCLIVEIMQHLPRGWSHLFTQNEVCHSFSNLITFRLPHAYLLSLLDKLSYLEVQIRHEEKDYHKKCPIHLSVQDILASALENVCEQLNFNNGRLQYGFHCQCGKSDDKHIAILTTLSPPFDYAQCSHGRVISTKLQHSHIVWLTEKFDETANRAAEDQNDYGLPEYKVFTDYYSKLVDTIPACSLSHYFVSENVISLTDHEEITKPTTPSHRAAQLLLNKVLYMLKEHKSVDCFNRMISIMEHHGDGATHALSQEIQSRLLKINSGQQDLLEPHSTTLEAAPPLNIVPGQLITEDLQSPEYLVIIKHYSKLVDTLTAKTLSHYFVSHKIISTKEEEEITKPTTSSVRAATLLLSRVINPLRAGFENCTDNFYIFLDITEQYGNEDTRHLSTTIRKKVNQMETEAEVKGSGDKSAVLTTLMDNK